LTDAKLDIMASSMSTLSISPLLESKDSQIRILEDENLSLKQELESLRVGFRDGTHPSPKISLVRVLTRCRAEDALEGQDDAV
jgi:hypothetical protein